MVFRTKQTTPYAEGFVQWEHMVSMPAFSSLWMLLPRFGLLVLAVVVTDCDAIPSGAPFLRRFNAVLGALGVTLSISPSPSGGFVEAESIEVCAPV